MARRFNGKPLTDEERAARRKVDRDRIEQAARALLTTDGWQRWIRVRASNGLSGYCLLISGRRVSLSRACWIWVLMTCRRRRPWAGLGGRV
ncbi:MAG: hypothetical protein M3N04_03345 [Actinomycetota bacterium]|nr:hypothetical protein [Actinomycetota bacterium]